MNFLCCAHAILQLSKERQLLYRIAINRFQPPDMAIVFEKQVFEPVAGSGQLSRHTVEHLTYVTGINSFEER